jgi:hypothetical protein
VFRADITTKNYSNNLIQNVTVDAIYCTNLPNPPISPYNPLYGNMLDYYMNFGETSSCATLGSCITDNTGNCSICLGSPDNTSYQQYCIGFLCLPIYNMMIVNNRYVPNEIVFAGERITNDAIIMRGEIYKSLNQDSANGLFNSVSYILPLSSISGYTKHYVIHAHSAYNISQYVQNATVFLQLGSNVYNGQTDANGTLDIFGVLYTQNARLDVYADYYTTYSANDLKFSTAYTEYVDVPMFPLNSTIPVVIDGYVNDNTTGNPIVGCPIHLDCYAYYQQGNPQPLGESTMQVSSTQNTGMDGRYLFAPSIINGSECHVYTDCRGYGNYGWDSNVYGDATINFSLRPMGNFFDINGMVYDASSCIGDVCTIGLSNVEVTIDSIEGYYSDTVYTNALGAFFFNDYPEGNISLTATKTGYTSKTETRSLTVPINYWYIKLSPKSELVWLKGKCVEVDANYNKMPVNCSLKVSDMNGVLIQNGRFDSSPIQIGYFSQRIPSGYYNIEATYKSNVQTQKKYINADMGFNDLIFEFKTSLTTIGQNFENLLQFFSNLMIFLEIIMVLLFLAVMSVLIATIGTGGAMVYRRRRR